MDSQQIRFGSITINVYTSPTSGLHTLSATVGGKRYKINRGRSTDIRNEAAKFASNISEGMPEQAESLSQKRLDYFLLLEHRMNGTPLELAVDFYLAHQDEKLVPRKVPELVGQFLRDLRPSVSKRYYERVEDELNLFSRAFKRAISEISSAQVATWIANRKVGNRRVTAPPSCEMSFRP